MIATMNAPSTATSGSPNSPKIFAPMLRKVQSSLSFKQFEQTQNQPKNSFRRAIIRGRQKSNSNSNSNSNPTTNNSPPSHPTTLSDDNFEFGGGADIERIDEEDDDDNGDTMQELINNFQGSSGLDSSMKSIGSIGSSGTGTGMRMKKSVSFSSFNSMKRVPSLLDLLPDDTNKEVILWFGRHEVSKFAHAEMLHHGASGITSTSVLDSSVPQNDSIFPGDENNDDDDRVRCCRLFAVLVPVPVSVSPAKAITTFEHRSDLI